MCKIYQTLTCISESPEHQLDAAGEVALERALRRAWAPVCRADELTDAPKAVRLNDEVLVVVRLGGEIAAFPDLCVHRGTVRRIPAVHGRAIPRRATIERYAATDHAGLIWVLMDPGPNGWEDPGPRRRVGYAPTKPLCSGAKGIDLPRGSVYVHLGSLHRHPVAPFPAQWEG